MDTDPTTLRAPWHGSADLATLARHLISVPFVYGLLLPIAFLDAAVSAYQAMCFRLWGMPRVRRSEHLILDRHKLSYLNGPQKLNCLYCGYANGVLAYAREIAGRTEQYWCPIKHAVDPPAPHARYADFIDYKDAKGFGARAPALRAAIQAPSGRQAAPVEDRVEGFAHHVAPYPVED
ncbi:MAG: hypothetical protein EPO51_20155 [Phenylobacterium sp.]|uniref:hypothetical protein n=1 Tax=Phenylobacterium sp. TaxID=1871053 RepID=UPI0011F4FCE6|nr:hypothetical protein [Phenylobacterium sp.]TAJ69844.1 MAG: hypothetical protein EPO51_20155 [Phenylobacterium sp.]